jgi:hypothetical protein
MAIKTGILTVVACTGVVGLLFCNQLTVGQTDPIDNMIQDRGRNSNCKWGLYPISSFTAKHSLCQSRGIFATDAYE